MRRHCLLHTFDLRFLHVVSQRTCAAAGAELGAFIPEQPPVASAGRGAGLTGLIEKLPDLWLTQHDGALQRKRELIPVTYSTIAAT